MRIARLPVLIMVAPLATACDRPNGESSGYTERDSAGVRIVENVRPARSSDTEWTVDSTLLSVGTAEGASGQQLHRVSGATRLRDGTLVIANGGSRELLRYDRRGVYLGATGREGQGPGEFLALSWVGRTAGDSLITWDRGLNRLSIFAPTGEYVRDYRPTLTETPMALEVKGSLSRGRLLLARGASFISAEGTAGIQRQPITGWMIDSAGKEVLGVGPFPGETIFLRPGRQPGATLRTPVPFGASTIFATGAEEVYVADSDVFAVRIYSTSGELETIARRPHTSLPVQPADVAAHIEERLESVPPVQWIRDGMRADIAQVAPAQFIPAIRSLRVDSEANLWIEAGRRPSDPETRWSVLDRSGRWLGDVALPAALNIFEIGPDYILAGDRDELDVERVRVLRLRKRAADTGG